MGIDHETMHSTANTNDNAAHISKLDGVSSMDDFMKKYEADHAANKAAKSARTTQNKAVEGKATGVKRSPRLGPVAIGARSSKSTIALHEKYQALGIPQPQFTFEGSSDRGWNGQVSFPGLDAEELQGIKDETIYTSKQEAKEGLSEKALVIIRRLEAGGSIKKMSAEARARSSKYKVALHDKHQKLGIPQPVFTYAGSTDLGWVAEVTFPGLKEEDLPVQSLKNEIPFPNKQDAKEALSKQALELVEAAEREGKFDKLGKSKGPAHQHPQEKKEPGPNYLGQLLEFQRSIGAPQPTYTDYGVGANLFTCQVTIDNNDGTPPLVFGSLDSTSTSKKAARQAAAYKAVEYFKAQGTWPDDSTGVGGIKKKKRKATTSSDVPELIAPTTPSATAPPDHQSTSSSPPTSTSYPQQVARLAVLLSLGTPEWRYTPNPQARDFHSVSCFFSAGGDTHGGPIGEVRNVFGKKKAKEECARLTLEYLKEVHAHRVSFGMSVLDGLKGKESVVQGAVGKVREGEEGMMHGRDRDRERDRESEGEMEFEDAVEEMEL